MNNNQKQNGITQAGESFEHVLIPVSNPQTADQLIRLAVCLTDTSSVLHIMNVTIDTSFLERAASWRRSSQLVMDMTHLANRLGRVAKPLATTSRSIPDAIVDAQEEIDADLVIMGWFGRVTPLAVKKSRVVNDVLHKAKCDVAIVKSRTDLDDVERLVVPVGGENNEKRMTFVQTFLWRRPTEVLLTNVLTPGSTQTEEDIQEMLTETAELLGPMAETKIVRSGSMADGLLTVTEADDLVIIGPGREWVFNSFLFGRHADEITNRAPCSVVMYKSKEQKASAWFRGLFKALREFVTRKSE
jgi:nucleotide-binding universal stress UspA family protein